MPRSYSTAELLASTYQRSFTAAAPRDFDTVSLLRLLNEKATTYLVKLIARRNTNYLVETVDIAVAAGQPNYLVPSVAVAGAVRSIVMLVGNIPYPLEEKSLTVAVGSNLIPFSTQFPTGYYWMGPYIVLYPTQSLNGTLRIHYHRRPSVIVQESACIKITSLPAGAPPGFYRVGFAGTAPAGYIVGASVDVVSNIPNFYRWQTGVAINAATASTLDLPVLASTSLAPAPLQIGDWVCLYDTAPVVTDAPAEVVDALLQATACDMLGSKGSDQSYQRALSMPKRAEEDCGPIIQQRNTGAMRKVSAFPDSPEWLWGGW